MDFSSICRTCLSSTNLQPIFKSNDDVDGFASAIFMATGIQVQSDDNLPQNMCNNCYNKINDTLKFRKLCKDSETTLLSIKESKQNKIKIETGNVNESTIKNEFNDNRKIINDDKKSINLLLNTENSDKTELQYTNTEYFSEDHDYYQGNNDGKCDSNTDISDNESEYKPQNDFNDTINANKDTLPITKVISTSSNSKTSIVEIPYDLIPDPVNQKITKAVCKLCNKHLSIRSIDTHMTRSHPGADTRKVKCELCDRYVMKEKLNRHMLMMHGNGNFKCGYCKTDFASKESLVDHVVSCTAKKRKRKVNESGRELGACDVCQKVMQKASLRMHKAVKHAGLKPVCEHCGKAFGNKFRLNEHYRAKHGYEKFKCSFCDFRSAGVMAMRNHERRHRGEKPFVCEACGAKFHAAYLLTQHKHSHKTEKLVKCDICPASFKANNSLHMHKLTCHSNSMYRCVMCCRSYKCRHYAVKHVRHVHRYNGTAPPLTVVSLTT